MIAIDTHVHWHKMFGIDDVLTSAEGNLNKAASQIGGSHGCTAVLLVAGIGDEDLRSRFESLSSKKWVIAATEERNTLVARTSDNRSVYLILGSQVISEEGLEVLGYLPNHKVKGGSEIEKIIKNIRASGGIAIVPWGFGKWIGKRKSVVESLIDTWENNFWIGDNGGRSKLLPYPGIFRLTQKRGIRILLGSDPLPIANELSRFGTCGFCLEGELDEKAPLRQIVGQLENPRIKIKPFARYIGFADFLTKQIRLRWLRLKS